MRFRLRALLALGGSALFALGVISPTAASGPTATVTPSTGLVDLQRITIRGSGFEPFTPIQVLECNGTMKSLPRDATACEGISLDSSGYTDRGGNYVNAPHTGRTNGFLVLVLPDAQADIVSIHCGRPGDPPCVLYIGEDHNNFQRPHAFAAIRFKGQPASGGSSITWVVIVVAVLIGGAGVVVVRRRAGRNRPRQPKLSRR